MANEAATIAIVLHDLPLGGSERIAVRLANRWACAGRAVTIFCGSRRGPLAEMIDPAVKLVECKPEIQRGPGSRKALGQAAAAFAAARQPDILFVPGSYHWPVMSAVADLPQALRPGVVAQIDTPLYRRGRGPLRQRAYNLRTRRQFRCVDHAVSLCDGMTGDMDRVLGRRITESLRLPALDDEAAAPMRAKGKLILAAGRLVPEKGFDLALRAFALMGDPDARLTILGEGPQRDDLISLAKGLGVYDRVSLPGYVADIGPWLAQARAFLLASRYEGYGAVIVEALAAGRPVVCTDCTPATAELLDGEGAGFVAPVGDARMLAAGLRRMVRGLAPDPERLAARVAGYRIGPISDAYLQVFDAVKARRAAARAPQPPTPAAARPFGLGAPRPAQAAPPIYGAASHGPV